MSGLIYQLPPGVGLLGEYKYVEVPQSESETKPRPLAPNRSQSLQEDLGCRVVGLKRKRMSSVDVRLGVYFEVLGTLSLSLCVVLWWWWW